MARPLWSDQQIASAVYEITYQNRTSTRTTMLVESKLTGMRNGYQHIVDRLLAEREQAISLLERARLEIDVHSGDDKEMGKLYEDIGDFLRGKLIP